MHSDPEFLEEYMKLIDSKDIPHQENVNNSDLPTYIGIELGLPRGEDNQLQFAKGQKTGIR